MPRRSVLYVSEPTIAGVAQCLTDWTAGLQAREWRVSLACPSSGWLADGCRDAGITVYPWEATSAPHRGMRRELEQLREVIRQSSPDVIHLNGAKAGFIGRWLIRGNRPTAFSPHSWAIEATTGVTAAAELRWERFAATWTDAIISVSEAEADAGRSYGIRSDYVVARNGINLAAVKPADDREALRRARGIAPDEIAVVCVGRMHRQKGQEILLRAWPSVAAPRRQLYFVGDGPLLEATRAACGRGDVRFVGEAQRREALGWMQAADVVVLPSHWEGMALVPLESLAMGTPVIASDVNGVREALRGPECGLVVPPANPAALARALNTWLAGHESSGHRPDARARHARRAWIADQFNLNETLDIIDATLSRLVAS